MKRWTAAIVCILVLLIALGMLIVGLSVQPQIVHQKEGFQYSPSTVPTTSPSIPTGVDKTSLIIQQNSQCWIGLPGATCGPERTYV